MIQGIRMEIDDREQDFGMIFGWQMEDLGRCFQDCILYQAKKKVV